MGSKKEYDLKYQREKLKQKSVWFSKAEAEEIERVLSDRGETFAGVVKRLLYEYIDSPRQREESPNKTTDIEQIEQREAPRKTAKPERAEEPETISPTATQPKTNNPTTATPAQAVKETSRTPEYIKEVKPRNNPRYNNGYC